MAAPANAPNDEHRREGAARADRLDDVGVAGTSEEAGLSLQDAARRLRDYGYNEVPERRLHPVARFLRKFWGPTPWMLEVTAALTWILDRALETYIVLGLLAFNGILGFFQEKRANAALEFLRRKLQINARVRRDGIWRSIPARELVPGDVIRLRSGDFVPADVRAVTGILEVDQSALTGESLPVEKAAGGLIVSGSTVLRGEAGGIVVATGTKTYYGRTIELVEIARPKLHMEEVTSKVVQWLIVMVAALLGVGLGFTALRGMSLVQILPLAVVLLVSAIPVALPTMSAITLALGSLDLARKHVLVTRLSAGEDAATMDVLCADKTGTITTNRLAVADAVAVRGHVKEEVLRYGALASEEANRDPIDLAFLDAAKDAGLSLTGYERRSFVPFEPATRRTETVIARGGERLRVTKGAVGAILQIGRFGPEEVATVVNGVEQFSKRGYRTIAVAIERSGATPELVGIAALSDQPRVDSARLIRELKDLGVSVKMLTGDSLSVAQEIATRVGLGDRIERMTDLKDRQGVGDGLEIIEASNGFAEVYPEDKYRIVRTLQRGNHVVGMTGDGVNDAPALRQAEVGIAVSNATDVAKKASSAVLTSEGLEGIVDLVKTGRMIYQRIVTWILNKIVKTFQIVVFVILAFLLTGEYVVSVFSMILFLFATDFVTLSISTDRAPYSQTPDTWDITSLARVAILLGMIIVGESLLLLFVGFSTFGLATDPARLHTFMFDFLVILGVLNVLILRERGHFWESRPSRTLVWSVVGDVLAVSMLSLVGIPRLPALSPLEVGTILGFSVVVTFLINDYAKLRLVRAFRVRA